jgi:methyl-accepting chemotaxis protein
MRISTKLRVGYIFSALVVILAGAIIIASFKQLHNSAKELRVIDTVMQGVFELNLAGHEFLLHQEKRPETQWGISYQALSRLLGQENLLSPNHRYLMDKLREDLGHANTLFSDFVSRQTSANAFPEGELSRKIQNRLQSQLLLKTQRMLSHATQLKHQIEDELFSIQRYTNWIIITLIIATALLAIISGYVISRSIIVPVRALLRGTKIIGSGNLEFRLKTDRRDEIGQLSESFDQMANDLNTVMISRDDLESKIAKRTAELTASNRRLSSEIEERKQAELELQGAFAEIKELKDQLETERTYLQEEIKL